MLHLFVPLAFAAVAASGGAVPVWAGFRKRLAGTDVIHRTAAANYDGIVGPFLRTTENGEAEHRVKIRPTKGWYKNLSIVDFQRILERDGLEYTYFSLADAGPLAVFMNVNPLGHDAQRGDPAALTVKVRGSDLIAASDGRIFYRAADKTVAIHGAYEGPARILLSRHSRS
jgi:hypothetical protein